jgi:hypothetical protein
MDINKKINEQNYIVESLNEDINNILDGKDLLNENLVGSFKDLYTLLSGGRNKILKIFADKGKRGIRHEIVQAIGDTEEEVKEKEGELNSEEDQERIDKLDNDINDLSTKLNELEKSLNNIESELSTDVDDGLKKIDIAFLNEYNLDIPKLKSPEFKRRLIPKSEGTMYFEVLGHNAEDKILFLKTRSFPDTIKLKLKYQDIDKTNIQSGTASLLYNSYSSQKHNTEGNKESVEFTIIKKEYKNTK